MKKQLSMLRLTIIAFALFVSIIAVFSGLRKAEFLNIDDNEYVTENIKTNSGLNWSNVKWAFTEAHSGHWHPLTWMSHMLDCELFGLNPGAHHLVNIVLHAATIVLLFLALHLLTATTWKPLWISLFIGLNPLRLESVAWVAERKDVLSMFFASLVFLSFAIYAKNQKKSFYVAALFFYTLGLLSKPMLVSVPLLLMLLDYWPLARISKPFNQSIIKSFVEKIPFFVLTLAMCIIAVWAQSKSGGLKDLGQATFGERFTTINIGYLSYLGKFFWPYNLGVFYPHRQVNSGLAVGTFLSLFLISYLMLKRKEQAYLMLGWLWFFISLLPVIGIMQIGGQQIADRWTYLPHIGLAIAITWWLSETIQEKLGNKMFCLFSILILSLITYETISRKKDWLNSEALFSRTIKVAPDNFFAHTNLGVALEEKGEIKKARFHYEEAVRLNPTYSVALNNLGAVYARDSRLSEALSLFDRALSSQPNFSSARYHRGLAREMMGYSIEALTEWLMILQIEPGNQRALSSYNIVLTRQLGLGCEAIRSKADTMESQYKVKYTQLASSWPQTEFLKSQWRQTQELLKCLQ
jgi:protein O-mannosyl-transferase